MRGRMPSLPPSERRQGCLEPSRDPSFLARDKVQARQWRSHLGWRPPCGRPALRQISAAQWSQPSTGLSTRCATGREHRARAPVPTFIDLHRDGRERPVPGPEYALDPRRWSVCVVIDADMDSVIRRWAIFEPLRQEDGLAKPRDRSQHAVRGDCYLGGLCAI